MITEVISKNGNLTLVLDEQVRQDLQKVLDTDKEEFENDFDAVLEAFYTNSEFEYTDNISFLGHLSQAEGFYTMTDNPHEIEADELWYYDRYMLEDWREVIVRDGFVEFYKA